MDKDLIAKFENMSLDEIAERADEIASRYVLDDYQMRKSPNTTDRQEDDLKLFKTYLAEIGFKTGDLFNDPSAWESITWGIVTGFVKWMLIQGYSIGSVNVRLSTVKTYVKLAYKAGAIEEDEQRLLVSSVIGYHSGREKRNVDKRRIAAGVPTRYGLKKPFPSPITESQAIAMKIQRDNPQGRRDALIMCLLLDMGLRVGEVAALTIRNVNIESETLTFYREKVDKQQTHKLLGDLLSIMKRYCRNDALSEGPLLRSSKKNGELTKGGMSKRAIAARVRLLGKEVGIFDLSPHDCRHYWATLAAEKGTPIDRLKEAGGWNSIGMPMRYIKAAKIANEGVKLE